ncbi:MAG: AMP-binding protein [Candidatus Obscuribacterales bacterium]
MNTEPAQSPLDAANLSAARLSENDVLSRLFAPASNLPEPRNEQAIVVVAHGKPERAVTHHQIENLIAYAAEQLKERGVSRGDKVVFFGENCPEFTATILACWSLNAMVLGQIVKASIVLLDEKIGDKLKSDSESEKLSAQRELQRRFRAFCKEQLPRYYRPMDWEFLDPHDSLPKTLAGKTDKKKM